MSNKDNKVNPDIEVEVAYTIKCNVKKDEQKICKYFKAISKDRITECSFYDNKNCTSSALIKYVERKFSV